MKLNKNILDSIAQFENIIGYRFNNKEYILEALTHSSYSNENKGYNFNERLEFLGAVSYTHLIEQALEIVIVRKM